MGAQAFHKKDPTKNAGDEHQRPRRKHFAKMRHASALARWNVHVSLARQIATQIDLEQCCEKTISRLVFVI
jgi:hypothetical protein